MNRLFGTPGDDIFNQGQGSGETLALLRAWGGTSLAFAIFISGGNVFQFAFVSNLLIAALTCGLGFVIHELAHRVVARSYGAEAHFLSNDGMLLISVLVAFAGFFLAAPGAVWHRGHLSLRQLGLVALAGPVSNMVLAVLFLGLYLLLPSVGLSGLLVWGAWVGYYINAWLGIFNMIPVDPFDGGKIIRWDKMAFGATVAAGVVILLPVFIGI